jgi:hypothetical protein
MLTLRPAMLIALGLMLALLCGASGSSKPELAANRGDCARGESRAYVATQERFKVYLDLFCGSAIRFKKQIEVPKDWLQVALDHDAAGRIYDLQRSPSDDTTAVLSMYDGRWISGPMIDDAPNEMVVNAKSAKAYILREGDMHDSSSQPRVTTIDGPSLSIEKSFQAGSLAHPWLLALDPSANIVVEPMSARYFAVLAPTDGRLLYKVPSVACAIADGFDLRFYAVDCLGNLVVYDPSSYREISHRALVGALLSKNDYRLPQMAVDANGTLYLADAFSNELMMFRPGETTPFRTIAQMVVRRIELDAAGNVYVLSKAFDGPTQSKLYVYSHSTGKQLAVYTFKSGVSATAMTVTTAD